ncbi:MAG TPA: diguanylate cyclase [Xanthomonadaceae bacterium]|nr:diguanylate cyclase [Xanthomonadaceae bacterium]
MLRKPVRGVGFGLLLAAVAAVCGAQDRDSLQVSRHLPASGPAATELGQILRAPAHEFLPVPDPQIVASPEPLWWRIDPGASGAGSARVLAIANPQGAEFELAQPPGYRAVTLDIHDPDHVQPYSRRALVFTLEPGATGPIFVRAQTGRERSLEVSVVPEAAYRSRDRTYLRIMNLTHGAMLAIGLVALLFWQRLRDGLYGWLALFLLLQTLYLGAVSGEILMVPGLRQLAAAGSPFIWFCATAAAAAGVFFVHDFADLERHTPRLARVLIVLGWVLVALATVAVSPWPASKPWFAPTGNTLLVATNSLLLLALLAAVVRGGRSAVFVLLALLPPAVLTTARALQLLLDLTYPAWLEFGMPFSMALSAVILTYGLADRLFIARRERDVAVTQARHDSLTGALNRQATMNRLEHDLRNAMVERSQLSVLFLDLDHFKDINDRYGHGVGDACLRALVSVMERELRQDDAIGRWGGEEFVTIMPGVGAASAEAIAERIRRHLQHDGRSVMGAPVQMTVSIGAASFHRGHDSAQKLIDRADAAMYKAKRDGRNRVVVAADA